MADIIESIHKITYEVDDAPLQRATLYIISQIAQLRQLNTELQNIQNQISKTSSKEIDALSEFNRQLDSVSGRINKTSEQAKNFLKDFSEKVLDGVEKFSSGKISEALGKLIDNFKQVGTESALSIGGAIAGFFSMETGIPVVIGLVAALAKEFLNTSKATDKANASFKEYIDNIKHDVAQSKRTIDEQKDDLSLDLRLLSSSNDNDKARGANNLKSNFSGILNKYSTEDIINGKANEVLASLDKQIEARERLNFFSKQDVGLQEKIRDLQQQQKDALDKLNAANKAFNDKITDVDGNFLSNPPSISFELEQVNRAKSKYKAISGQLGLYQAISKGLQDQRFLAAKQAGDLFAPSDIETEHTVRNAGRIKRSYDDISESLKKVKGNFYNITGNEFNDGAKEIADREKYLKELRDSRPPTPRNTGIIDPILPITTDAEAAALSNSIANRPKDEPVQRIPGKLESFLFGDTAKVTDDAKRHQEEIKKTADAYKSMAQVAANAFKTIYDAQIASLDAEIKVRQQRVDAATKLAERGNTEALKIEQDRLDATEKKRNDFARKQQIVNAALALSDAIVAVASAAAETGPGAIAVVPAVIAAIVAGYAAVSAATKESSAQAFAKGVIGFKGKGGPTDDANWVRISSGESVITAEGTRKNRNLLEAINKGANLMPGMEMLSTVYPMLKAAPVTMQQGYASKGDLSALEGKLDEVVSAIEDNRLRQNIFFNEHGVGIMTDKAISRERRRWK